MSIRNLEALFKPASVALLGASEREGTLGRILLENLRRDFSGPVYAVNPKHATLLGQPAYASVEALPETPDLALIATPPETVPAMVSALAERGTRGVCVITAGIKNTPDANLRQDMLNAARPHLTRIVGPNCVGLQVPGIGLNASFASVFPRPGKIAFVAQSGAVITAVLDWAYPQGIGFSHVVSVGDMADVDFGDMLDYLANDPDTEAILLYIEAITHSRKFLSAARAAARTKPVIVVKAGRMDAGAKAAASHTGALAGMDAVYDAAFRRAGMLRVLTLEELFDVVETLALATVPPGDDLTVLTNGGGLGVLAADALMSEGGTLTALTEQTLTELDEVLPGTWSRGNPVDIIGDANGARYAAAIGVLHNAPEVRALLILNCPTALASSDEVADAVMASTPQADQLTLLTSWTGEHSTAGPRKRMQAAGIPVYDTPEEAVHAFMQMVNYRRNQDLLRQVPPSLPQAFEPDRSATSRLLANVLSQNREWLTEPEAKQVLQAYGIPSAETLIATTPAAAADAAAQINGPVAIKVLSVDIIHKTDVGGVALNVAPEDAEAVTAAMLERITTSHPAAHIQGVTVQRMVSMARSHELIAGMITDQQFGPVMLFGHGGTATELLDDKALALPPLNIALAKDMIARTRIYKLLQGYRGLPGAPLDEIEMTLVRLSQLIIDHAQIKELDINPLLVGADGIMALDARIRVASASSAPGEHLAIKPYPSELQRSIQAKDAQCLILRPVMPEDELRLREAFGELSGLAALRMTQIDYDRQMVLVVADDAQPGKARIYAASFLLEDPDRIQAEFAVAVTSTSTLRGLGGQLTEAMLSYARGRGIAQLLWRIPADQTQLLRFADSRGFTQAAPLPYGAPSRSQITMTYALDKTGNGST